MDYLKRQDDNENTVHYPPRLEDYIMACLRPRIEIEPKGSMNEIYAQVLPKLESVIGKADVDVVRSEKGDCHHWIVRILPVDGNKRTDRYLRDAVDDVIAKYPELKGRINVTYKDKEVVPDEWGGDGY